MAASPHARRFPGLAARNSPPAPNSRRPAAARKQAHQDFGEFALPVPAHAGDAVDLALSDDELRDAQHVVPVSADGAQVRHLQDGVADRRRGLALVHDRGADDEPRELSGGDLARIGGGDRPAAAHHGHAVGEGEHVVQLVGHQHDCGAARGQSADRA